MATPQRAVPEVLQDLIGNFQEIIRSEFLLAKTEVREKTQLASGPLTGLVIGITLALFGTAFLLWAVVFALSLIMSIWAAALLVGGTLLLISIVVIASNQKKLKQINPTPSKTIRSLEEIANGRNV
ncbi:MAG: phage holin family protein [Candidatus Acidiferrum sp.]